MSKQAPSSAPAARVIAPKYGRCTQSKLQTRAKTQVLDVITCTCGPCPIWDNDEVVSLLLRTRYLHSLPAT